jgi:hypothetical protein
MSDRKALYTTQEGLRTDPRDGTVVETQLRPWPDALAGPPQTVDVPRTQVGAGRPRSGIGRSFPVECGKTGSPTGCRKAGKQECRDD